MLLGLLLTAASFAQPVAFEVASIKVAPPPERPAMGRSNVAMTIDDARVDIKSASVSDLINLAFGVRSYQVQGPAWLNAGGMSAPTRYSVQAVMPKGATKEQVPAMLQTMLADRFKMTFHREEREQAVYALVVGKGGSKLQEVSPEQAAADAGKGPTNTKTTTGEGNVIHMEQDSTIASLCDLATRFLDRPVVDMTELKGRYRMKITLSTDDMRTIASRNGNPAAMDGGGKAPDAAADPTGGTVFTSVTAMGLKLESRKMPVSRVVIDTLEKAPTEN